MDTGGLGDMDAGGLGDRDAEVLKDADAEEPQDGDASELQDTDAWEPWDADMGELWDAGTQELPDTWTAGRWRSVPCRRPAHQVVEGVRQLLGHLQLPARGHRALALVLLQVEVQGPVPDVLLHHDACGDMARAGPAHTLPAARPQRRAPSEGDGHSLSFPRLTPCSRTRCLWESWLMMLAASRKDCGWAAAGSGWAVGTPPVPGWGAAAASPQSSCGGCHP